MEVDEKTHEKGTRNVLRIVSGLFVFSPSSFSILDATLFSVGILSIFMRSFWERVWNELTALHTLPLYVFFFLLALYYIFDGAFVDNQYTLATIYLFAVFYLFSAHKNYRNTIINGYTIGALIVSVAGIGIYALFHFSDITISKTIISNNGRLDMFFEDPNVFGAFLVPAILTLVYYTCTNGTKRKIMYSFFAATILICLILTFSRGAMINLFASSVVLFAIIGTGHILISKRNLQRTLTVLSILVLVSIVSISIFPLEGSRIKTSDKPRIENLTNSLSIFSERSMKEKILGTGSGSYESFSSENISAHNTYTRSVIEYGLLGTTLLALFFFFYIRKRFVAWSYSEYPYFPVIAASISGIAIQALFIDTFHWRHFWLLLGIL